MTAVGLVYAFTLGLAATVNPCGFPLLPAYLAVFLGSEPLPLAARLLRALRASAAMTAGFVGVFAAVGVMVAAGLRLGLAWIPVFTALLGLALLVAGAYGAAGRRLRLPVLALPFRSGRSFGAMAGYGAAFATTSLGCAFPLFAAAVAPTVATSSALAAIAAALAYAVGMGLFVAACSALAALLGAEAVRVAGRFGRILPRVSSILMMVVGVYLLAYGIRLVVLPGREPPLAAAVAGISSVLTTDLSDHPLIAGGAATVIVCTALILTAATLRARRREHPEEQ